MLPLVPEFENVDRDMFEKTIVPAGRPAVLRKLVADWPMVSMGLSSTKALSDHIRAAANDEPTIVWNGAAEIQGRFSYSDDLKSFNHTQENIPLSALLDRMAAHHDDVDPPSFYAGGVLLRRHLPGLLAETPMPLLPADGRRIVSLWLGNRVRTPAHWDLPQNLVCVVAGRRRFTLFPTDQIGNLYIGPVDFTLSGQPSSLVDFRTPDFEKHPRFAEALKHAERAELNPGDVLYMPSLWFHHVESLDPFSAMINFWWRDAPDYMGAPLFSVLYGLLTLRDLNHRERQAWREIFDHYLFRPDDVDPMAHIPVDARGVFAPMTPAIRKRLKELLARPLSGDRP
jgi:hypothetical protein